MAKFKTCSRCEGKGRLAHFGHVMNGVCLKCRGTGKEMVMKTVKTETEVFYACDEFGNKVKCTDRAAAEKLVDTWSQMNIKAEVESKMITVKTQVPA